MFEFLKKKQPIVIMTERCFTETEFDAALDEMALTYRKVLDSADKMQDIEMARKIISERIIALEHLREILIERGNKNVEF